MWGGGERVRLWSGFSLLYYHSLVDTGGETNASQDESVQYAHTRTHMPLHLPHAVLNSTVQFSLSNSLSLIRSNQPISRGNPHPAPPSSSLSRHCCCEDEMSVLLKVPLKHNSDLWCLIVSFQSCERRWEHILIARGDSRAATTDRLYREVLLTTSAPFIIIQIDIS